jgi:epoxyqueuosine reductase
MHLNTQALAASLAERIKSFARELGCELAGVAPVADFEELDFYLKWLQDGYAGEMHYLQRQLPARLDPRQILPEAQSVIVIGVIYHTPAPLSTEINDSRRGWISRYAWGDDYHEVLREKLAALHKFLEQEAGPDYKGRYYVDTGPVLDRVFAKYAGLGWFGKNTNLINQRLGSWFFIGELITNLVLEFDAPPPDRCGTCRRCLDACPTEAFIAPYVLDSRRCISYLTIELRGEIPGSTFSAVIFARMFARGIAKPPSLPRPRFRRGRILSRRRSQSWRSWTRKFFAGNFAARQSSAPNGAGSSATSWSRLATAP